MIYNPSIEYFIYDSQFQASRNILWMIFYLGLLYFNDKLRENLCWKLCIQGLSKFLMASITMNHLSETWAFFRIASALAFLMKENGLPSDQVSTPYLDSLYFNHSTLVNNYNTRVEYLKWISLCRIFKKLAEMKMKKYIVSLGKNNLNIIIVFC